ncbi:MAG: hypothetical protein IPJ75_05945 [Ignavibacteriales bacterium]|nr:hypothetical protein [Ignavibacteriales bacterium]
MRLFVYVAFVAAFILGFSWTGHTTLASNSGDPKNEVKKQECPYSTGGKTSTCPYSGKKSASNSGEKEIGNSECPYTGKKGECPYSGDKSECPVTGEKGKVSSGKESMPVKKIEVKKV